MQQLFLTSLVRVVFEGESQSARIAAEEPRGAASKGRADRVLPILNAWGLVGEIQLWQGLMELPPEQSRLLQNLTSQAAQALERTRMLEAEDRPPGENLPLNAN
jgi:hypothetical protein